MNPSTGPTDESLRTQAAFHDDPPPTSDGGRAAEAGAALLEKASASGGLWTLAQSLLIVATSLYLLERLEPVLRPLLIAVLLCYLFLPFYNRLRKRVSPVLAFFIIAGGFTIGVTVLGRMVYHDIEMLEQSRYRFRQREAELERKIRTTLESLAPSLAPRPPQGRTTEDGDTIADEMSRQMVRGAASAFVSVGLESVVIAFYMIFLLQSAAGLPTRIRSSFDSQRAGRIMTIVESINHAVSEYLRVKVKASLLVALPVWILCMAFGVTGGATWAVLTFLGNFLPYIGAMIAVAPPLAVAMLQFTTIWPPLAFAAILLTIHAATSNFIEPAMTGRALGLNPLVVLIGLAFWSLLWGIVGLVLAVPLTVIFKIILEHTPSTRPFARLISEQDLP